MERLQKFLARAGVASRRAAEQLIADGRVLVNGETITVMGTKVDPQKDLVVVNGKPVGLPASRVYFVLYKPPGVVTTLSDPQGRSTVADFIESIDRRLFPVGRLDFDAEGALLITDDGELANQVMHPSHEVPRVYLAKVKGSPDDASLQKLIDGVRLEDGMAKAVEASRFEQAERNTWLKLVVTEGRQHLIKRLCAAIGHPVVRLFRPAHAGVSVAGLRPGQWRALTPDEVRRVHALVAGEIGVENALFLPARRHGHGFSTGLSGDAEDERQERPEPPRVRSRGRPAAAAEGGDDDSLQEDLGEPEHEEPEVSLDDEVEPDDVAADEAGAGTPSGDASEAPMIEAAPALPSESGQGEVTGKPSIVERRVGRGRGSEGADRGASSGPRRSSSGGPGASRGADARGGKPGARSGEGRSRFGDKPASGASRGRFGDKPAFGARSEGRSRFGDKPAFGARSEGRGRFGDTSGSDTGGSDQPAPSGEGRARTGGFRPGAGPRGESRPRFGSGGAGESRFGAGSAGPGAGGGEGERPSRFGGGKPGFGRGGGEDRPRRFGAGSPGSGAGGGEGERPRRFGGEKPSFGGSEGRGRTGKPSFGSSEAGDRPRRLSGGKPSFGGSEGGGRPGKSSFGSSEAGDRPRRFSGGKPSFGSEGGGRPGKPSFGSSEAGERPRRFGAGKPSFGGSEGGGRPGKPSFGSSEGGDRPRRFGAGKPSFGAGAGRARFGGKPGSAGGGESTERPRFGGGSRSFDGARGGGSSRFGGEGGEKRPFGARTGGAKPPFAGKGRFGGKPSGPPRKGPGGAGRPDSRRGKPPRSW